MKKIGRCASAAFGLVVVLSSVLSGQDINLAAGGADLVWRGTTAGANAGRWLDQGPLSPGDNRRDLVVGAPGSISVGGSVYVIFAGPVLSGSMSLSSANVVITGTGAGDGFGAATAVGPILVNGSSLTSNLVVGAPGALGGRGAIYVFDTPLNTGSLTAANAAYVIEGAPGDRLGSALATADINGDGYREIVIGAPGNNRVYVMAGGAALSGVKDLSVVGADLVINGSGIGNVIQAGDVTGDGVFEILIGSPTANAVYLLTGGYPAISNLPADADAVFSGIDVGDATGQSIRIADIDADGRRDILIGAPGADGPSNSRTNAGEAYALWGRSSFTSMNLATADVTFIGGAANFSLGQAIAAGDINRDSPNDAVFLVEGATASGELLVFYGRARTAFGAATDGGRRVVDFASVAANRRIVGDGAAGPITAAQVHEVTGEGARDVVVGIPGDNESRGGAFFAISPKMIANPSSIAMSLVEGAEGNRAIVLENASTIPISWTASADRTWLQPWPTSGTSVAGAYASLTLYVSAASLPQGTHTGTVTVTSTSEHLEMSRTVDVTLTVTPPTPAPCTYSTSPTTLSVGYLSASGSVTVTTQAGCEWSAVSNDGFITITNGAGRVGSGTLPYTVAANSSASPRTGTVTVAGGTFTVNQAGTPSSTAARLRESARADFNGDGQSDLLAQSGGSLAAWALNGQNITSMALSNGLADANWRIAGSGDFNGDGKADIVFHHDTEGWVYLWYMNGTTRIGSTYFSRDRVNTGWRIAGVGDFNADNKPDIVWQNDTEGRIVFWLCDGVTVLGFIEMPIQFRDTQWRIAGTGDFNADGKTDLVLRHLGYGEVGVWLMDGTNRTSYSVFTPGAIVDQQWQVAAVIDANGDDKPDVVWRHEAEGWLAVWHMDGVTRINAMSFAVTVPSGTRIAGPK